MKSGRTQRSALNFISSFGLTAVTFATAMISSRLVLSKIGDERFGAFRSLFELFGYLNLFDAGLSASLRPLLAQSISQNQPQRLQRILRLARYSYRAGMSIAILIGLIFTGCIVFVIPVSDQNQLDLKIASLIFTVGLINIWFGPIRTLCESLQQSFLLNLSLIVQSLCITFTTMFTCTYFPSWGISAQALSVVLWVFFFNLVIKMVVSRLDHEIFRPSISEPLDQDESRHDLFRNSRDSFILMLAGRASLQSNSLILGLFAGQTDVTNLYATQRLFDVIQSQLFAVGNASWAALAEIFHQNRLDLFRTRVTQLVRLILVMAVSTVVPVVCFNEIFVALWVGADRYGGLLLSVLLAANTFALAFTVFSTWCLTGTGHLNAIIRMTIVTTIFDIIATLVFTQTFGLIGPVLGSCSAFYFCSLPWHARLLSSQFQISRSDLIKSVAAPLLMAPPYAFLIILLKQVVHVDHWISLALIMAGPILIYLIAATLFVLDKQDRQILLKRFGLAN